MISPRVRFVDLPALLLLAVAAQGMTPAAAPAEVQNLDADRTTVTWDPLVGAVAYRLYRAPVSQLPNYCYDGSGMTAQTFVDDPGIPPVGEAYAYVVQAVNSDGSGTLGSTSGGTERSLLVDCDSDLDGLRDSQDNCPVDANAGQQDGDGNGLGDACQFESSGIELMGRITLSDVPCLFCGGNEMWSYTSPLGEEYAILGLTNATAFVRVTDPSSPGLAGFVDGEGINTTWRDMAVFGEYAYIVTDGTGVGLQVADLTHIDSDRVTLVNTTALGQGFTDAHNVYVNEASGYLYLAIPDLNSGLGLTAVDLNTDPVNPSIAGFWTDTASNVRCHDLQVLSYTTGPFSGREIAYCFAENDGLRIVDVTDKGAMFRLSSLIYPDTTYTHQGWLTEDRQYVLIGDELDERDDPNVSTTTTYIVDVSDPANPSYVTSFTNGLPSIDHNLMVRGDFVYEANYSSGLRVFELCNINDVREIGFFDTRPEDDAVGFQGAWGVDARLPSGTIVVSDRQRGLFVLDPSAALAASQDRCSLGDPLDPVCSDCVAQICALDPTCCNSTWDDKCIRSVRQVCDSLVCPESAGSCAHTLCTEGFALAAACDVPPAQTSCVDAICAADPDCCGQAWDGACVDAVGAVCGLSCD